MSEISKNPSTLNPAYNTQHRERDKFKFCSLHLDEKVGDETHECSIFLYFLLFVTVKFSSNVTLCN